MYVCVNEAINIHMQIFTRLFTKSCNPFPSQRYKKKRKKVRERYIHTKYCLIIYAYTTYTNKPCGLFPCQRYKKKRERDKSRKKKAPSHTEYCLVGYHICIRDLQQWEKQQCGLTSHCR